jgi:hypothetical protein
MATTEKAAPARRSAIRSARIARSASPSSSARNRHTSSDDTDESTTAFTPKPIRARLPVASAVMTALRPTTMLNATVAPHSNTARRIDEATRWSIG